MVAPEKVAPDVVASEVAIPVLVAREVGAAQLDGPLGKKLGKCHESSSCSTFTSTSSEDSGIRSSSSSIVDTSSSSLILSGVWKALEHKDPTRGESLVLRERLCSSPLTGVLGNGSVDDLLQVIRDGDRGLYGSR